MVLIFILSAAAFFVYLFSQPSVPTGQAGFVPTGQAGFVRATILRNSLLVLVGRRRSTISGRRWQILDDPRRRDLEIVVDVRDPITREPDENSVDLIRSFAQTAAQTPT